MYSPPRDRHARPPWWAWPNVLALDAPAVAVVWQHALAAAHGVPVPAAAAAVLALVVWGVYLADRFGDALPGRPPDPAARHRFARRHRRAFGVGAGFALAAAGVLAAVALPGRYLLCGAGVAAGLGVYLAAVHGRAGGTGRGAKELAVGVLFAAGVAVPLMAERPGDAGEWLPAVAAFAALGWLNCGLIARWEAPAAPRWPVAVAAGTAVAAAAFAPAAIALAVVASAVLLGGLDRFPRLGGDLRRVLADVALLTPLLAGAVL